MQEALDGFIDRIGRARQVADELRENAKLHRLAMQTVFVLEDCYETLRGIAASADTPIAVPAKDVPV